MDEGNLKAGLVKVAYILPLQQFLASYGVAARGFISSGRCSRCVMICKNSWVGSLCKVSLCIAVRSMLFTPTVCSFRVELIASQHLDRPLPSLKSIERLAVQPRALSFAPKHYFYPTAQRTTCHISVVITLQ